MIHTVKYLTVNPPLWRAHGLQKRYQPVAELARWSHVPQQGSCTNDEDTGHDVSSAQRQDAAPVRRVLQSKKRPGVWAVNSTDRTHSSTGRQGGEFAPAEGGETYKAAYLNFMATA